MTIKEIRKNVMHVLGGTILTEGFFLKNVRFMLVIFVIAVLYISNRYSCLEKMSEIESLQKDLRNTKYEALVISSQLISVSRESQVQSLVNKAEIGLQPSQTPNYRIEK